VVVVVLTEHAAPEVSDTDRETPLDIRELTTVAEFDAAVTMFCKVWSADSAVDLVNASTLRAWSMSDNYVVGAYLDGELVGGAVAFRGDKHIHSHLMGVLPGLQGRGFGGMLKEHQLRWARQRDFHTIRWTFDPLVRRNAHFNLWKLGATVLSYEKNLYGSLHDGINDGEETDRLLLEWTDGESGTCPHPPSAAELLGKPVPPDFENRIVDEADAALRPEDDDSEDDDSVMLVATPVDIEGMRVTDHKRALQWRTAVRNAFDRARAANYQVVGFTADGWYVLRR
jgi:predicted GNAT superfamily acetyltransferase